MFHSYAETLTLTCDACGRDFDAQFWLIVDAAERLDLLECIRAGDLDGPGRQGRRSVNQDQAGHVP